MDHVRFEVGDIVRNISTESLYEVSEIGDHPTYQQIRLPNHSHWFPSERFTLVASNNMKVKEEQR